MPRELSNQFQKATEVYNQKTILRGLICAIPYIGSSIDVILSTEAQKIIQQRLNFLLEQLKRDISELKEKDIDNDYLQSEEFFDLLIKTLESAAKTRHREKIKIYSKILRNSLIEKNRQKNDPEEYLSALSELSLIEIEMVKTIYEYDKQGDPSVDAILWRKNSGLDSVIKKFDDGTDDLDFYLKRIERTGLIKEIVGTILGYTGGVYQVTEGFKKMMVFINFEENDSV